MPVRLTAMTRPKLSRSCGEPSRLTVRAAKPIPAQFTATRSGWPDASAAARAASTSSVSVTFVFAN